MQGLTTLDFQILHAIQRIFSCSVLDFLMPKITALGNGGILWILLAILLLILPKTRKNGIQLGVGCVGCGLIGNLFLKNVIARNRPCWIEDHTMLIAMPTDFSFPSGHTMVSFAAATVLWHWNRKVGIAAYLLAAVIAFSRLYLPQHTIVKGSCGCLGTSGGTNISLTPFDMTHAGVLCPTLFSNTSRIKAVG